ncbi:amidohydrolase family protein [Kribbella sp. NPDC050124]|uniref:amidohydrolase family protein n=1 Tax=Kribbella sp. NPDC050124 TaxID=3364114 RepID=UPI0037B643DD
MTSADLLLRNARLVRDGAPAEPVAGTTSARELAGPAAQVVAGRRLGRRAGRAFAFGGLLAAGAELRLGSDAPVAPLDPWLSAAAAVHRSDDDRESWHPEQEIPVGAALDASTRGGRTPRAGGPADLVVLDADPMLAAVDDLRTFPVHSTLLAGRWTWQA